MLKIEIPFNPGISLLGTYPKSAAAQFEKDRCTPMFIAALFTIAKKWKQPKCPSVDEWIKKMWYIYTMEYYSAIRRQILPFATTWMELEGIMLSEISQTERDISSNDFTKHSQQLPVYLLPLPEHLHLLPVKIISLCNYVGLSWVMKVKSNF